MVLKDKIPLISIPTLNANRTENNGKLLRRPQRRQLPPILPCESPPSSPDYDDIDQDAQLQILEQQADRVKSANSDGPFHAGQTTPYGPPPPTEAAASPVKLGKGRIAQRFLEEVNSTHQSAKLPHSRHSHTASEDPVPLDRVLLKTRVHAGPDGLMTTLERRPRTIIPFYMTQEKGPSEQAYERNIHLGTISHNDPALKVQSIFSAAAQSLNIPIQKVETVIYSKANFKRLTEMIHERLLDESCKDRDVIKSMDISKEIPTTALPYRPSTHAISGSRIPQKQILIQLAAMLTDQIKSTMEGDGNIKAMIRSFPKWTPTTPLHEQPKAEIVLYEFDSPAEEESSKKSKGTVNGNQPGVLLKTAQETHFMDSRRTNSPFDVQGDNGGLTMTDTAVLDALVSGGAVLSLKAHFIDSLPVISPIYAALRYINLSFNNFTSIPDEVLLLTNLEVLKLRNNPIREIPDQIQLLKNLRTFEMSFCLVTYLPDGLFTLSNLQYLDVSYNKLSILPENMRRLKSLQVLFVEGNQLPALPASCLSLSNLRYIRVRNNYMHPIFWPDYMRNNNPQRLEDLAGLLYKQFDLDGRYGDTIPPKAKQVLAMTRRCDCCHGPLVGNGLTLIRPGGIFGVKNVPFMFKSCSHYCAKLFMKNKDNLADVIYSDSDTET